MTYGHAERTLATVQVPEEETVELLATLPQPDAEEPGWLQGVMAVAGCISACPTGLGQEACEER